MNLKTWHQLDKPNATEPTFIYINFYLDGKRCRISTRFKVHPKDWNDRRKEVKRSHPNAVDINGLLKKQLAELQSLYLKMQLADRVPTLVALRQGLTFTQDGKQNNAVDSTWTEFMRTKTVTLKPSTLQTYRALWAKLKGFEAEQNKPLRFADMNAGFLEGLRAYLLEHGVADQTYGRYVKVLKTFLQWAEEHGVEVHTDYRKFKKPPPKANPKPLHVQELDALRKLTLDTRLSVIRDLFVFACLTGLRYSDLVNLKPANIEGDMLRLEAIKTGEQSRIPILPEARELLDRYAGKRSGFCFPTLSNQKANVYLKEVALLADLTRPILKVSQAGAERREDTKPLYDAISFHVARQTFITLNLERGIPTEMVMMMSGHKKHATLKSYINISDQSLTSTVKDKWSGLKK